MPITFLPGHVMITINGLTYGGVALDDILSTPPGPDPDFPHTCPRCQRAAYCGLVQVSHQDEIAASECPAPRAH